MSPARWSHWKKIAREYLASASCHGMPYILHPKLSIVERACWAVMVVLSLSVCIAAIVIGHRKWIEQPILVSFAPKQLPIWEIPFPAITVCPQTRIDSDIFNVTAAYQLVRTNRSLHRDGWRKLRALAHVCSMIMRPKQDYYGTGGADGGGNASGEQDDRVVQQLVEMALEPSATLTACMWSFNFRPCEALWVRKVTENGVCYSFNMLSSADLYTADQQFREDEVNPPHGHLMQRHAANVRTTGWTMEGGYTSNEDLLAYPRRIASAGFKGGSLVTLRSYVEHKEYVCSGALQGYKVTIHPPDEFPRLSEHHIRVSPVQSAFIVVKPRMLTTQKSLHRFPPSKRQCYFNDERQLRFFRVYNEQNCEFECLTNFTLATCGCVTFAMPRLNSTRVCGAHEMKCYEGAVTRLLELDEASPDEDHEPCGCLPACTSLKYDVELSTDKLNLDGLLASLNLSLDYLDNAEAMFLYVYFNDNEFLYTERVEYMSASSELANFGGTLALLAGMSLTSLVEILYYLTVRPLCLWLRARYVKSKVGPGTLQVLPRSRAPSVYPVRPWIP